MDKLYDFTDCPSGYEKYGGSDSKISIRVESDKYMLKFPEEKVKKNELETSHSNGIFSEYIGSHVFNILGIPAHETLLGLYRDEPVVACKDFTNRDFKLHEFKWFMLNMYRKNSIGRIPTYRQLYEVFFRHPDLEPIREKALQRYWDTFIVDAFLGNFDRHKENFGYLVDENTGEIKLAPVYDCGGTLYPSLREDRLQSILSSKEAVETRVYTFPNAALNLSDDIRHENKANYFDFISSGSDENCTAALLRIQPRINLKGINEIIENTPLLSDIRIEFYEKMLRYRKELILDSAVRSIQKKKSFSTPNRQQDFNTGIADGDMMMAGTASVARVHHKCR